MVSLTAHAILLVGLALVFRQVHRVVQREFRSQIPDSALSSSDSTFQDLDQTARRRPWFAAGSFAPNLAMTITSAPISAGGVPITAEATGAIGPELAPMDIRRTTAVVLPTAMMLGQAVSIRATAPRVGGVEGAVDRIAVEIIRRFERGDASSSGRLTPRAACRPSGKS